MLEVRPLRALAVCWGRKVHPAEQSILADVPQGRPRGMSEHGYARTERLGVVLWRDFCLCGAYFQGALPGFALERHIRAKGGR